MKTGSGPTKAKGALVAMLAGAPSSPSSDEEEDVGLSLDDHGFKAVAKAFGIPPEREAAAQAALKQYVKSCVGGESESEEYEGAEFGEEV